MIVGSWTYSISNSNAIKAFNTAATYFKKYGAIGASIGNHLGRDNGLYSVNIGYENYAHFGEVDDQISNDENWAKDMEPYFSDTKWETNNFYEPMIHTMPSDAGVKPVFANWMFFHKDVNLIQEKGDIFIKAWMDNGATGGTVGRLNGKDNILPLMGRPLFTNRDKWNFYTMTDKNNMIKLPISHKGRSCTNQIGCDNIYN